MLPDIPIALDGAVLDGDLAIDGASAFVLFSLGKHTLAFPLAAVRSVERPGRFTQVPFARPWLRGITSIRGAIVSVVDLGRFAGAAPAGLTPGARMLVTQASGMNVALLVDRVSRIAALPGQPGPVPPVPGPLAEWWCGAYPLQGELVPVVDIDRLLQSNQLADYQIHDRAHDEE